MTNRRRGYVQGNERREALSMRIDKRIDIIAKKSVLSTRTRRRSWGSERGYLSVYNFQDKC
jgi:hypothetical protein